MPIIVPIEDNKAGLATATGAKFRAPDYSGSGLEALGAGAIQLGAGIEERRRRAAEAIAAAMLDDRHQRNIDDAAAKKAYVDYSDGSHEALHGDDGLLKLQGAVAHAAFAGLVEKLVDNHDKSLSKLDDVQRAVVAPAMNERLRSDVERAAEHVRQQGAIEQRARSGELQQAAARDAVNHADDPDLFDHHLATGENAIRQQANIDNVGNKLLDKQLADYRSGVHSDIINAVASDGPPGDVDRYGRLGDPVAGQNQSIAEAAPESALTNAPPMKNVAPHRDSSGTIASAAQQPTINSLAAAGAQPIGEAYSANEAEELPAGESAPPVMLDQSQYPDALPPYEKPPKSPSPLRIGMPLSPEMGAWLRDVAPKYRYSLNEAPDFITQFRARNPDFVRIERENFEQSKIRPSWFSSRRERTILVYQNIKDPKQYRIRKFVGESDVTVFYYPNSKTRLPFGQLPQVPGYKLIIAEHTHPRPVSTIGSGFGFAAKRGPSNADIAYAWLNPDVHFIIKSVYSYDRSDDHLDEDYYYGKGFHGQGLIP